VDPVGSILEMNPVPYSTTSNCEYAGLTGGFEWGPPVQAPLSLENSALVIKRDLIYYIEQMSVYLGECEQIVLLAVLRLGEKAYGVPIRAEIENRAGRKVTVGALYATLDRLEAKGLVHSWFADPTAQRGGRSKRYFKLLPAGVEALSGSKAVFDRMWEGLNV
jgi:PadR family transcriptional regulator, regulatory protein PadR